MIIVDTDEIVGRFVRDMRRYLVDHGLLARGRGRCWRSGGWIDVFDH